MRVLAVVAVVAGACAANNAELERKVEVVAQNQRSTADLAHKLDELTAEVGKLRERDEALEHQLDQLAKLEQKALDLAATRGAPAAPSRPQRPEPEADKTYAIAIDGDPSVGPADAKVTFVLAYDYADPYTNKIRDTLVELRKKYGNDLRIVYKQFVVHPQVATAAALASCAAARQHKFVELDDVLWEKGFKVRKFDKDKCWETADGCTNIVGFAGELHLNVHKLETDMIDCEPFLKREMAQLTAFGVGATPSMFINGRTIIGAQPIENFTALIDVELARANQRIAAGAKQARYYQEWIVDKGLKDLVRPSP